MTGKTQHIYTGCSYLCVQNARVWSNSVRKSFLPMGGSRENVLFRSEDEIYKSSYSVFFLLHSCAKSTFAGEPVSAQRNRSYRRVWRKILHNKVYITSLRSKKRIARLRKVIKSQNVTLTLFCATS